MSKELKKQEENALAKPSKAFDLGNFVEGGVYETDVKIAKTLIVQPMSTAKRENKELKDGDLFLSTSKTAVISLEETVTFTPIFVEKLVQSFRNETGVATYEGSKRGDWIGTEAVTAHNKNLPEIDENTIRNRIMACYSAFYSAKVPSVFPVRLDFKGSSKSAFQTVLEKVISHAESGEARNASMPQMDLVFSLRIVEKINKKNQLFYILDPKFERLTTEEEYNKALKLIEMVKTLSAEDKYNDQDINVETGEVPF